MTSFEAKEKQLLDQLHQLCDREGRENNPDASAVIFNQLGLLYKTKSPDKISLLQSVALLNAAIVRQPNNLKFQNDLRHSCKHVLDCANAKQKESLLEISNNVAKEIKDMRTKVKNELLKIKKIPHSAKDADRLSKEQENVKKVSSLQDILASDYKRIMSSISRKCIEIMGRPPCRYALVGMGSLARKEISPYSDFEHILVLENYHYKNKRKKRFHTYFRWYSVIFHVIVLNLQETILPSMCISGLNDSSTPNGNWFYDAITIRGISFDGLMPHACKFPLGRTKETENKPWTTELIKPISEMVKYLETDQDLKNGYKLSEVLTKTCFVEGDAAVYETFSNEAKKVIKQNSTKSSAPMKQLDEDLKTFNLSEILGMFTFNKSINIKRIIYRSVTLFISALGHLHDVDAASSFEIIAELKHLQIINECAANRLSHAVAVACHIRLSHYMSRKRQDDEIYKETEYKGKEKLKELTKAVGQQCLLKCIVTAFALQKTLRDNNIPIGKFDEWLQLNEIIWNIDFLNSLGLNQEAIQGCDAYWADHKTLNYDDVPVVYVSCRAYIVAGQWNKCIELLEKIKECTSFRLEDHPEYPGIKLQELQYLFHVNKYSLVIKKSEIALSSNVFHDKEDLVEIFDAIGRSQYYLKNHREVLSAFRDGRKHYSKKILLDLPYAIRIEYISVSLIMVGCEEQGLHWAREGVNYLVEINATDECVKHFKFHQIIEYVVKYPNRMMEI